MPRLLAPLALALILSLPLHGQTAADATGKSGAPPSAAGAADSAKLPGDTLTLSEAKSFLRDHKSERDKVEEARKAVFKQGAKATPEERAKLIGAFRAAQKERMQKIQEQAPRAQELEQKIRDAEKKAAPPAAIPPTKG